MEYMVNTPPCFLRPYKNRGTLRSIRKNDSERKGGVSCEKSIEVPEIPLSYSFTGARNTVTPKAFMMPATVSIIKLQKLRDESFDLKSNSFHCPSNVM